MKTTTAKQTKKKRIKNWNRRNETEKLFAALQNEAVVVPGGNDEQSVVQVRVWQRTAVHCALYEKRARRMFSINATECAHARSPPTVGTQRE